MQKIKLCNVVAWRFTYVCKVHVSVMIKSNVVSLAFVADVYFYEYEIYLLDPVFFVCCRHTRMLIRKETLRNSV